MFNKEIKRINRDQILGYDIKAKVFALRMLCLFNWCNISNAFSDKFSTMTLATTPTLFNIALGICEHSFNIGAVQLIHFNTFIMI